MTASIERVSSEEAAFAALMGAWRQAEEADREQTRLATLRWRHALEEMTAREAELKRQGLWTRGPADLMSILRLGRDEVRNCRVLGWLFDPLAPHGFGTRFLEFFLADLSANGAPTREWSEPESVRIELEEDRLDRRADIVLYGEAWTVLIEAKIDAAESPGQGRDLAARWAEEEPVLVFLTPRGRKMITEDPTVPWLTYSWRDVARLLERALHETSGAPAAPGRGAAVEYLTSLRRF